MIGLTLLCCLNGKSIADIIDLKEVLFLLWQNQECLYLLRILLKGDTYGLGEHRIRNYWRMPPLNNAKLLVWNSMHSTHATGSGWIFWTKQVRFLVLLHLSSMFRYCSASPVLSSVGELRMTFWHWLYPVSVLNLSDGRRIIVQHKNTIQWFLLFSFVALFRAQNQVLPARRVKNPGSKNSKESAGCFQFWLNKRTSLLIAK